jgi:tetratricopeptide (TPR) repeat protein
MRAWAMVPVALLLALPAALAAAQQPPAPLGAQSEDSEPSIPDASDRAAALDRLFEMLREAASPEIGRGIEQVIWSIWLESDNEDANQRVSRAILSMQAGDYPSARVHLDEAIAIEPDFAEAWNKRATVYFLEGDYAHSLEDIDVVLELEPRHFGALSGLGMILEILGRKEDALLAFRRTLEVHPQLPAVQQRVEALSLELEGIEL